VVFCLEVFEYIYNPVQALENLVSFLRNGGVAYISFPAIYPVHEPKEIDYLRYTKKGIEKLLANSGFTSWNITPRVSTFGRDSLAYFYQQEGMHPVKGDTVIYDIGYMVEAYVGKRGDI
jgi:SAM-dependent methyltransferase